MRRQRPRRLRRPREVVLQEDVVEGKYDPIFGRAGYIVLRISTFRISWKAISLLHRVLASVIVRDNIAIMSFAVHLRSGSVASKVLTLPIPSGRLEYSVGH